MKPNIFDIATKELSQDAFITWLLAFADNDNQKVKALLLQSNDSVSHQADCNGDTSQAINSISQIDSVGETNQPKEDEEDIEEAQLHWNRKDIERVTCPVLIVEEVKDNSPYQLQS